MNLPVNYTAKREQLRQASKATATNEALQKNITRFENWCVQHQVQSFPCHPNILEAYLIFLWDTGLKVSTIEQAKWAIDTVHRSKQWNLPGNTESVKMLLSGIKRSLRIKKKKKASFTIDQIRKIQFRRDIIGIRDRLILTLGFAAGLRRSEMVSLNYEDIEFTEFGLHLRIRQSKGNQYGAEEHVDVVKAKNSTDCPITALYDWLSASGIVRGALIRSVKKGGGLGERISSVSINQIVKRYARQLGFNQDDYGAHSLRAGCATFFLNKGVPLNIVAKQLRHKNVDTTLQYDRNLVADHLKNLY